jgi:Right handed beta helix region
MRDSRSRSGGARGVRTGRRPALAATLAAATVIGLLSAGLVGTSAASAPAHCLTKPDATNTGASGTRAASKVKALVHARSKLQDAELTGGLTVSGDDGVVRNVSVNGPIIVTGDRVTLDRVTAKRVIVHGASNLTVRRSNLSGGGTAVNVTSAGGQQAREIKLTGNYIHDPASAARDSYSGTRLRGAQGITISCSNYALGAYGRAAILMEDVNGGTSRVTVARNWLDGGGFTVVANAKDVALRNNTFGKSAKNGICSATSGQSIRQSRNRTSDGAHVQPCPASGHGPSNNSTATSTPTSPAATATTAPTATSKSTTSAPAPTARTTTSAPAPKATTATPVVRPSVTASGTFRPSPTTSSATAAPTTGTTAPANSSCSFKPSASTTGASGSRTNSSVRVLDDGQTLQNTDVAGNMEIRGNNVTLHNVSVAGSILVTGDNAMIDHVTTQGIGISSASGTTVQYANIGYSKGDGIHVTSDSGRMIRNAVLRYNYIHDPRVPSDAHYDGTQVRGVNGLTIDCSVYDPGPFQDTFNAAVYLEDANGGDTNVRVTNNWLYGHAFPVMVDAGTSTFTKNRIGGDIKWDVCYPGKGLNSSNFTSSGNVWDATNAKLNLCGLG